MDNTNDIIIILCFILTIFQFKVAIESLKIQKNTNNLVDKIETKQMSDIDIKMKVLNEIQEDMDDSEIVFKIVAILERPCRRRKDMGKDFELNNIFNQVEMLLRKIHEDKK